MALPLIQNASVKLVSALPLWLVHPVARPYIAGQTADEALALAADLQEAGFVTTLDRLGEDVATEEAASEAAAGYVALIEAIAGAGVERNISIKLTQLGLRIDPDLAFDGLGQVLGAASRNGVFVRIDMEDASVTDATLEMYGRARGIWPKVGAVLQARLRRTVDDARRLAEQGANIRLCKGIYPETSKIALADPEEIRESFLEALGVLLDQGSYVGIATHDLPLIERAKQQIRTRGASRTDLEFQSLLGVPIRSALERLRDQGYKVRLYLPYGQDWYAYSMRRLRENPAMISAILKGLLKRDRMEKPARVGQPRGG